MNLRRVILIIFVLSAQYHLAKGKEKYSITQLEENEVIYLETLSKIKLYHEQWKIVIGYDLSDLEKGFKYIENAYSKLMANCVISLNGCSSHKRIGKRLSRLREVAKSLENVLYLAGVQRRTKRGLFDFVGEISKTLFGTLSDSDATYYNNELDKLYADQKNTIQYVKNQTSIILKTLTNNEKYLNSIKRMNEQFNRLRNLTQANEANILIDETLLDLDEDLQHFINEIRNSEEMIVDARHGTVKPYVLSPRELFNSLREHKNVNNFPVPLEETQYTTLIDISKISMALTDKRLLIQILIPMLEDKILELTRVISLPRHGWLGQSIVDTTHRLILMDPNRVTFMPISELELTKTRELGEYKILERTHPDYNTGMKDNCLTEIITKHESSKCTTKYMQIQNALWVQLHTNQDWIGIAPKEEKLHILCPDKIARRVIIHQNFIFHLEPECTATSDTVTLKPGNLLKENIEIHKTVNLLDQQLINETLAQFKLTNIPLDIIKEVHVNPDRLQTLGKTLDELNNMADRISGHQRTITWKENFMYYLHLAGYIALGSILFVFLYKIGLFTSIINILKQLFGNCYNHCSFGNQAATQHVSYSARPLSDNLNPDPETMRKLINCKI